MPPSVCSNNSGRKVGAKRHSDSGSDVGIPEKKRRRVHHDVIEGIEIFSFEDELELEYFSNIEEPLPRKIREFRGFGADESSVDLIKTYFDRFVENLTGGGNMPRRHRPKRVEVSHVADEDAVIILSDDENASKLTDDRSKVEIAGPVDSEDETVQIVNEPPLEVINIDSDSDDDVIMVSDPKAPLPQPVKDCLCPNCGKVKRIDQSRRVASDSDKDSGVGDLSVVTDEVTIIIDEDGPAGEAPGRAENGGPPEEIAAQPAEVQTEEVLAQPAEVQTEEVLAVPAEVQTEELPVQPAEAQTEEVLPKERDPPLKVNDVFSLVAQPSPVTSSSLPKRISPKGQKPSRQYRIPATVPQSVKVVSQESRKTIILKVNGAKSTILSPAIKNQLILPAPPDICNSSKHPHSTQYIPPGGKPCGVSSSEAKASKEIGTTTTKKTPPRSVVGKTQQPNELPRTYCLTIPPNTMRVTVPPGFSGKSKVTGAQQSSGAKGRVQVGNSGISKSGITVARSNPQEKGLIIASNQPQAKQQISEIVADTTRGSCHVKSSNVKTADAPLLNSLKVKTADASLVNGLKLKTADASQVKSLPESHLACGSSGLKLVPSNEANDSTVVEPPMSESPITETGFELVLVEDDTKSVVRDLVDFVCQQEHFPSTYPYDEQRTELFYSGVPCRKLSCRLGCICISLAKKNVRRVRCRNADCVFGCLCMPQSVVLPANRHAKTMPNMKVLGISRRKQVLTVLPDCDADRSGMASGSGAQPAVKSFLSVQKLHVVPKTVSGSHGSTPDCGMQASGFGSSSVPASRGLLPSPKVSVLENGVSGSQRSRSTSERVAQPSGLPAAKAPDVRQPRVADQRPHQGSVKSLAVPVTQPKRFFGREKIPIPERALVCMTPGLGYVPLEEITPKVTIRNPFKPDCTKSFLCVRQATEWLNSTLHAILKTPADLRWVVADKRTIEKKQLHRLSIDLLKSPNCTISRTGAVFTTL